MVQLARKLVQRLRMHAVLRPHLTILQPHQINHRHAHHNQRRPAAEHGPKSKHLSTTEQPAPTVGSANHRQQSNNARCTTHVSRVPRENMSPKVNLMHKDARHRISVSQIRSSNRHNSAPSMDQRLKTVRRSSPTKRHPFLQALSVCLNREAAPMARSLVHTPTVRAPYKVSPTVSGMGRQSQLDNLSLRTRSQVSHMDRRVLRNNDRVPTELSVDRMRMLLAR